MAGRSVIAKMFRYLLLSSIAAGFVPAPVSSAVAEPVAERTQQLAYMGSQQVDAMESGVRTVFSTRWSAASQDVSVDADGKIGHPGFANVAVQVGDRKGPRPESVRENKNSQLRSFPQPQRQLSPSECGPSPVDPDAIKTLIAAAAERHRVDPAFALAIAFAESRFDRVRNSPKGARGPMQLIPATAMRFGVDDICDPASNIDGGIAYLRQLFDEFSNPLLVAAAYNAGENRVREQGGIPPIAETLGFVAEVINYQLGIAPTDKRHDQSSQQPVGTKPFTAKPPPDGGEPSFATRRTWVGGVMQF